MLCDLLGGKSAERVLLFLFVNDCCYASEIQKIYRIALTPLQSILAKLEKAGVLASEPRGKTKVYRFNTSYPLLDELKALLKKAFLHLPPEEKRVLFSRKEQWGLTSKDQFAKEKRKAMYLGAFWERLAKVRRVLIQTQTGMEGMGEVTVEEKPETLIFTEKGRWTGSRAQELDFSNVLRWTLDSNSQMIGLEHLRYGLSHPVFLFNLSPTGPKSLSSIDSHLCAADCYHGRIEFDERRIRFLWRILGPQKNEILCYTYEE